MDEILTFIQSQEEWLMQRILTYARKQNYTQYTSTLLEAWRLSINMLSQTLIKALTQNRDIPELGPDEDYTQDPIAAFGILEAKRHRERGITLSMFLGLMKYYRQSYKDLFRESGLSQADKTYFELYTERFFDRIELGFTSEWSEISKEDALQSLEETNRRMTNEKNKYLTLFESQHDPVLLLNEKNELENINFAAAELFILEHVPGATYYRKLQLKEQFPWLAPRIEAFNSLEKNEIVIEEELETIQGLRFFQIKLKKMLDVSQKFAGTVVILNDITEKIMFQRELEQAMVAAEKANKAKSNFLAHMSHELRTPLNGILGYAQILKKDPLLTSNQATGIDIIEKSGTHLLELINDVLDLAKIEAEKIDLYMAPFDFSLFLNDIVEMVRIKAWQKKLEFRFRKSGTLPDYVLGDKKRLSQVLINILSNAVKFTDSGSISITVEYTNGKARFNIKDTGIGIEQAKINQIFAPFTQLTQREGTGLGLSISKRLIELMKGTLEVKSVPKSGTVFTVTIELEAVTNKQVQQVSSSAGGTIVGYTGEPKKIVIVDDKEINRLVLTDFLVPLGFIVFQAKDAYEGYELALKENPDLIITDLVMSGRSGFELVRLLRDTPLQAQVKIFTISASTFEVDKNNSFVFGADEFIPKPVNFEALIGLIEKHLNLNWIYSQENEKHSAHFEGELQKQFILILPPADEITKLYNYAVNGDIEALSRTLDGLENTYPDAGDFYSKLRRLVKNFKIAEIIYFLKENSPDHLPAG